MEKYTSNSMSFFPYLKILLIYRNRKQNFVYSMNLVKLDGNYVDFANAYYFIALVLVIPLTSLCLHLDVITSWLRGIFLKSQKEDQNAPTLKDMGFLGSLNKKCKTKNIQHGMTNDHF